MAGAGYKLFNTGDVLTAAQVNTYLNEQTVMVFASSAARTSALSGVLAEGMVSYLQDTNAVEVYNGSAWVGVSGAGDVTEVQAGTGISVANGTGPIPIVTSTVATTFDAKGDLVVGTGADTFAKLTVGGTNGHTLQVDSSTATGLKWAAAAGGGKVLQVVQATYATETSITTDSTYSDTGGTITITPTSATSKVLLICSLSAGLSRSNNTGQGGTFRFMRGATEVFKYQASANSALFTRMGTGDGSQTIVFGLYAFNYLDEPATTSATTYKIQGKVLYTSNSGAIVCQSESTNSVMLALEIGA
jgi:predicted secreted protein